MALRTWEFWQALCDTPDCVNGEGATADCTAWVSRAQAIEEFLRLGGSLGIEQGQEFWLAPGEDPGPEEKDERVIYRCNICSGVTVEVAPGGGGTLQ